MIIKAAADDWYRCLKSKSKQTQTPEAEMRFGWRSSSSSQYSQYRYTNSNWYGYDDIILNNQYYTSNNINININIDIISISISNTWIWTKKCGGSERKQHDSIISIRCLHICFNFDLRPRYQSSAATFSFRIRVTSLYFPWAEA